MGDPKDTPADEAGLARVQYPNSPELWGGEAPAGGGYDKRAGMPEYGAHLAGQPSTQQAPQQPQPGGQLQVPAGVDANAPELAEFRKATEGLDPAAAQRLLSWHFTSRTAADAALHDGWRKAARSDAEIGGPQFDGAVTDSLSLLGEFSTPALRDLLRSPMGDHPEVIRFLAKVSRALKKARVKP